MALCRLATELTSKFQVSVLETLLIDLPVLSVVDLAKPVGVSTPVVGAGFPDHRLLASP